MSKITNLMPYNAFFQIEMDQNRKEKNIRILLFSGTKMQLIMSPEICRFKSLFKSKFYENTTVCLLCVRLLKTKKKSDIEVCDVMDNSRLFCKKY